MEVSSINEGAKDASARQGLSNHRSLAFVMLHRLHAILDDVRPSWNCNLHGTSSSIRSCQRTRR